MSKRMTYNTDYSYTSETCKLRAAKNHAHWMERKSGSRFSAAWRFRTPTNSEKMKHCRAKTKVQRYLTETERTGKVACYSNVAYPASYAHKMYVHKYIYIYTHIHTIMCIHKTRVYIYIYI